MVWLLFRLAAGFDIFSALLPCCHDVVLVGTIHGTDLGVKSPKSETSEKVVLFMIMTYVCIDYLSLA